MKDMGKPTALISVVDRLASLGEMVRLRILRVLEAEELSVGEVARVVQLPQSTVSRHLKALAEAGWVQRRAAGTATLYAMSMDDLSGESRALWRAVRDQMGEGAALSADRRRVRDVLEDRKTDSQTFFGRYGGEWDRLRGELFGTRFLPPALLSLLDPSWVVLDVGCGSGNAAEHLAPAVERVVALDQSDIMLESARRRLEGVGNAEFVRGSAEQLPLGAGSVDAVVCSLVLHHVVEPARVLGEMARVLRSDRGGGVALVVDMVAHDREEYRRTMGHQHLGFSRGRMEELMRGAGLERVRYRELSGEVESKGPGLFVCAGRLRK